MTLMVSDQMEKALNGLFDVMLMEKQNSVDSSCQLIALAMALLSRRVGTRNAREIISQSMDQIVKSGAEMRLQ